MKKRQAFAFIVMILICIPIAYLISRPIIDYRHTQHSVEANLPIITHIDQQIGWRNTPGSVQYTPTVTNGEIIRVTVLEDGSRLSEINPTLNENDERPTILFVGGSWTFGLGASDEQTYISHLQKWHPEYKILNQGVNGYGTVQSYLRLEEILNQQEHTPVLVIYGYIWHHDLRNVAQREWLISISQSGKHGKAASLPYCSLEGNKLVWHEPIALGSIKRRTRSDSKREKQAEEVTHQLVVKMGQLCQEHDTRLLVHFMTLEQDRFERFDAVLAQEEISSFPNHIEMDEHEFECPWDPYHPSAYAHYKYALNLDQFIQRMGIWSTN